MDVHSGRGGYAVTVAARQALAAERYWSLLICAGLVVTFGMLLFGKWLG